MSPEESVRIDSFMRDGFKQWLTWQSTLDMIEQTAREFGDDPKLWKGLTESTLYKLLEAAYSCGALNMGLSTGVIEERHLS